MNLVVDIGNSRLKWGVAQSGLLRQCGAIDYRRADVIGHLRQVWRAGEAPEKLAIASVAGKRLLNEVSELAYSLWPKLELVVPQAGAKAFGVSNAYSQPEKLGIDRWLALLAVHHHYPGHCCVFDCGTAITADVINSDGQHLGGLICPGLRSMKKALAADTADLHLNPQQDTSVELADNTNAAIEAGALLAAVGLVEAVVGRQQGACRLILCGGDAQAVAGHLKHASLVDMELVLKGLSLYCDLEIAA